MDESKDHEAEKAVSTKSTVDVLAVEISPNPAALSDKLMLKVDFHLETPVANGVWDIEVPHIDVSGIQSSQLANCGLLIASLKRDNRDVADLKMVAQVSEQRGVLQRIIYSPLE